MEPVLKFVISQAPDKQVINIVPGYLSNRKTPENKGIYE